MSATFIDSRLPVDTSVEPIKVNEEDLTLVVKTQEMSRELEQVRAEIGRLYQTLNNLLNIANRAEDSFLNNRKELLKKYELDPAGKWVVDFESKVIVKLLDVVPNPA